MCAIIAAAPPSVDPGCPPQSTACAMGCPAPSPTPATLGGPEPSVLQWINRTLPNCPANAAYAQWATSNDILRPVSKMDPCPPGYSYSDSYDNHMLCKTTTHSEVPPEPIYSSIMACSNAASPSPVKTPAPSPAPAATPKFLDLEWYWWIIILSAVIIIGMLIKSTLTAAPVPVVAAT